MKHAHTRLTISLLLGVITSAGLSIASAQVPDLPKPDKPTLPPPPVVKDNPNADRARAPRLPETIKAPGDQAIDKTPPPAPNATNAESRLPAPRIRRVQNQPPVPEAVAPGAGDPVLTPTGRTTTAVTASLDSAKFAPTIRTTPLATRDQMMADIETRMSTTDTALASFNASMRDMSESGRKHMRATADEVKAKGRALKHSVHVARKAAEQDWDAARSQLASDYEAYATALAKLDAAAGIAPPKP